MAEARRRCAVKLARLLAEAGLVHPLHSVFLRTFKHERLLEVWGRQTPEAGTFRQVATYPILGASGTLGPKRREGDRQVPEGFYRVTRFNPRSRFHLSLGLEYPNAADLRHTRDTLAPGSDIFIHGGTESKGCLAMGDASIEEIYLLARDSEEVTVHLFPCRLEAANRRNVLMPHLVNQARLAEFWQELQPGYQFFETYRLLPRVEVDERGHYVCGGLSTQGTVHPGSSAFVADK